MPYVALLVIVGSAGAYVITRDMSSRATTAVNEQLLESSLRARAMLHEGELYLLESASLAANLDGMSAAMFERDAEAAAGLLGSVLALKDKLNLVVATVPDGTGLVEFSRDSAAAGPVRGGGRSWSGMPFVDAALANTEGAKEAGFLTLGTRTALGIAAPICSGLQDCSPVGVSIVAMDLEDLAQTVLDAEEPAVLAGLTIFDNDGQVLATAGVVAGEPTSVRVANDTAIRRSENVEGVDAPTLYVPFEVHGRQVGMMAVRLPSDHAYASVRSAATRALVFLLIALAGIVGVGAMLSRHILAQTRPLLRTSRALGTGDLTARAPVVAEDELGELARGLNQMADQLQASHETMEVRIAQRTEEIQRLSHERTEFFASLSHELRTPIALIISHAEMLLDPDFASRGRPLEERGQIMLDSGRQLLAVVNDILDLARLESGSLHVELDDVVLPQVFRDSESIIRGLTSGGNLRLTMEIPEDLPPVRADARRLREVIINLVDNSVKYTPPGGSLAITASADADCVSFHVADTGVGIPPEVGEHIFEAFVRVAGTATQRGEHSTGLGLALSKKLIEAQSGTIGFQSSPATGTVFTVSLPRAVQGTSRAVGRSGASRR